MTLKGVLPIWHNPATYSRTRLNTFTKLEKFRKRCLSLGTGQSLKHFFKVRLKMSDS